MCPRFTGWELVPPGHTDMEVTWSSHQSNTPNSLLTRHVLSLQAGGCGLRHCAGRGRRRPGSGTRGRAVLLDAFRVAGQPLTNSNLPADVFPPPGCTAQVWSEQTHISVAHDTHVSFIARRSQQWRCRRLQGRPQTPPGLRNLPRRMARFRTQTQHRYLFLVPSHPAVRRH